MDASSGSGKSPPVVFSDFSVAQARADSDRDNLVLIVFGVFWSYPALRSMEHVQNFVSTSREKLKCFFVDEDVNWDLCQKYDIIVGTPVLLLFGNGKQFTFHRKNRAPIKKLVGPLNPAQIRELIQVALLMRQQHIAEVQLSF